MNILRKLNGFGSFLEAEEEIVGVYRQEFSYALSRIAIIGTLWWGWAWVAWFWFPFKLFPVWIGLYTAGIFHSIGILLWWYYNAILVTNMNVIIVDWKEAFYKKVTRIDYWNLDEIVVKKGSLGAFMYHYGDLVFRKLSDGEPIEYKRVGNPHRIATIIDDFKEKMVHERNFSHDSGIKDILSQVIGRHIEGGEASNVPNNLKNRLNGNFGAKTGLLAALGGILLGKKGNAEVAIAKERDLEYIRSHWTDFLPWKRRQKAIKSEEIENNPEIAIDTSNNQKIDEQTGQIVHHHHYYAHNHHKQAEKPSKAYEKQTEPVKVERFTRTEIEKQDLTHIHEKKLDDTGGIALHFDRKN